MSKQLSISSSPDLVADMANALRTRRRRALAHRIGEAREPKDVLQMQAEHMQTIMEEADIIKEVAIDMVVSGEEQFVAPTGELLDGNLSPRGLKTLSEVVNQQNEAVSVALGMATKITGNMSRVDVHRHQITESIIHDPAGEKAEVNEFEIEPQISELTAPEYSDAEYSGDEEFIEGEVTP